MLTISYGYAGSAGSTIKLADTATAQQQTAAIQSALNAVAGHAGATVTLGAGTFTVAGKGVAADGILRVGSETTFQGAGMGQTVIKLADGASGVTGIVRTDSGSLLADGSAKTTSNVVVKDLSIDGNMAHTNGTTDGFYCGPQPGTAQHDSNITVDHVEIMNVSRYGFDPHEQTVGLTISNSVAHHNGVDGFVVDFCQNVQLINDTAYANGRHGINIVTGSSDVSIVDANVHGNGDTGVVVQTGDNEIRAFTNHVTITGGTIENNAKAGIDVRQATDIAIEHVAISGNGTDGISLAGVERAALVGNVITQVPSNSDVVKIVGYIQDFANGDTTDDRYIATHGVTIDGVAQPDPVIPPDVTPWTYHVTAGDDVITGSTVKDVIAAGSGNDWVSGGRGSDLINGEDGNDTLFGNSGNDTLNGGAGNDALYGGDGNDKLMYTGGVDSFDGGAGTDTIDFAKFGSAVYVNLSAASGLEGWTSGTWSSKATNSKIAIADITNVENVKGTSHSDTLIGNGGDNALEGGGGNDTLSGGAGNDVLAGGSSNDVLNGGAGNDLLTGGTGADRFQFNTSWGVDTVKDFTAGLDKLEFAGLPGVTSMSSLTITSTATGTDVAYGADHIILEGIAASSLTSGDFLFHG